MTAEHKRTARRRRVWSETLPYEALVSPAVTDLLVRYGLEVLVAVTPELRTGAAQVFRTLADRGIVTGVWPMLSDHEGRWASSATLGKYVGFVDALTADLAREGVVVREVAFDLEPPFAAAKSASHGGVVTPLRTALALRKEFASAARELTSHVARLGENLDVTCAAVPLVLLDGAHAPQRPLYQALLGTPVDGIGFRSVSVMAYTSIVEGWSGGLVDRRAALGVLAECARLSLGRYGTRASLSLGTVGTGAFEDEPVYRSPRELAEDVATARAFGVDDLTLFDLGGLVRRGPPEAWLDAFVDDAHAAAKAPLLPRRVRLGSACLRALARFSRT